jgi:hypothetical protein
MTEAGQNDKRNRQSFAVLKDPSSVPEKRDYTVVLMPIADILPTEETDPANLEIVRASLLSDGFVKRPLCIEKEHRILMDGHHRLSILRSLGCTHVPVVAYDYRDIAVVSWTTGDPFDYREIIKRGLSGNLFPAKTTRHLFRVKVPCHVSIADLMPPRTAK